MHKFKYFSVFLTVLFLFSSCDIEVPDQIEDELLVGIRGKNAFNDVVWKGASDKAVAFMEVEYDRNNTQKNTSSAKISSNAQNTDFSGISFVWDSKLKNNGYLKIKAELFEMYKSITLTTKESNTFWDFTIAVQPGQRMTNDGCYVFNIPKIYNNSKNIKSVFITYVN